MKKILSMVLVIVLVAGIAIGGTMAYLTDRDNETNVFTVGDVKIELSEKFEQYAELMPGKVIEKIPTITNTGKNDAWVWMTFAIPSALDNYIQGTEQGSNTNVIHWNPLGATAEGYVTDARVAQAIKDGKLPEGITAQQIIDSKMTWNVFNSLDEGKNVYQEKINEVDYNVYVLLYNKALEPGETTLPSVTKVFLDAQVDIDPNGDWYRVVNGEVTPIAWNSEEDGNPIIYVNAYAIQSAELADVKAGYDAYVGQWGKLNGTYDPNPKPTADEWDGTADTSWYNDTDTEFVITTAEQLAGFAKLVDEGKDFAGKTVKLGCNIDLYKVDENGELVSFDPIGCFSDNKAFEGTFDGQGNTISNMYQNGWALANGYWDGPEYGLGLFGLVENATVKNVNFDGASLPTEANIMGVVASGAADCVFENITVTNSYMGNHSWYSGGIVGWVEEDVKFINCDVDENTVISSQWGDFNNANGGVIGGCDPDSTIYMKDCDVACVIDAYNDVTSAYEWYSYRSCGMLIGDTGQMDDPDNNNVGNAIAPNLTCENVTVTYGNWANYHYCEFGSSGYPFCRVEAGESTGAYGNARVKEYTDANGNKVVDDNHAHNAGEKHNELIVFDQLYGGESGDRYCTYGTATHDGVTVIYNNK